MMKMSFGPPGHRGVTHLMAVGADPDDAPSSSAFVLAAGSGILGLLVGSKRLAYAGLGAALALAWVRRRRFVEITQPSPR